MLVHNRAWTLQSSQSEPPQGTLLCPGSGPCCFHRRLAVSISTTISEARVASLAPDTMSSSHHNSALHAELGWPPRETGPSQDLCEPRPLGGLCLRSTLLLADNSELRCWEAASSLDGLDTYLLCFERRSVLCGAHTSPWPL